MNTSGRNRLANTKNPFQGDMKKVLAVCSAGLLRSPTIAWILSNPPFNFNTRACGANSEYALIPIDDALILWADEIVVVESWMAQEILHHNPDKKVHLVATPDNYSTRDPELVEHLTPLLKEIFKK